MKKHTLEVVCDNLSKIKSGEGLSWPFIASSCGIVNRGHAFPMAHQISRISNNAEIE
jgi:hypothetical protein